MSSPSVVHLPLLVGDLFLIVIHLFLVVAYGHLSTAVSYPSVLHLCFLVALERFPAAVSTL